MNDDFERLVNRFSSEWQAEARKAFARLFELLKNGKKLDVAVDMLQAEYPALFTLDGLQPTLVEAACYGYGIAPTVLTSAMYKNWEADLSKSWAADNMKLSKRLHTASIEMRNRIIDTIREQMSRNSSWVQTARALFDGYNADKVINEQALPKYITEVRRATRGSVEQLRAARKAINNIERLAQNGAPTKSLKTAYKNLVEAALTGSEKQLENACYVAIQEKSRYVADRIARTEQARAYSDGFFRSVADDEDVVAVRWQLGTRHPVFDICDMYMRADLFGLGAGIYPKDKTPPLPAHPFCLCRLSKVYSLDKKPADQIRRGGDKWLQGMSEVHQNMVLGIEGAKAWRKGDDWRKYMRSWKGLGKADTRLRELVTEPQGRGRKTFITPKAVNDLAVFNHPGLTKAENILLHKQYKELLQFSMNNNGSNEVAFVLSRDFKTKTIDIGNGTEVKFSKASLNKIMTEKNVYILHNHPRGYGFSIDDLETFRKFENVKALALVTNSGRIELLQKTDKYDILSVRKSSLEALNRFYNEASYSEQDGVEVILTNLVKDGLIIWKK